MADNLKISEFPEVISMHGVTALGGYNSTSNRNVQIRMMTLVNDIKNYIGMVFGVEGNGKIYLNELDKELDYLGNKLHPSLKIEDNLLVAVTLKGLLSSLQELNYLQNTKSNVQIQLNNIDNKIDNSMININNRIDNLPIDNFLSAASFNPTTNILTLTLTNGTQFYVDLSKMIDYYFAKADGGLDLINNEFFIKSKGIIKNMLSDEIIEMLENPIIDNLTSTSITSALSANQGRVLNTTKEPNITVSTATTYWNGLKQFVDFATSVRSSVLTGLSIVTNTAIIATDSLLVALGKLQAQINLKAPINNANLTGTPTATTATVGTSTTQLATTEFVQKSIVPVIDNLTSTSITSALSANQGRVLNTTKEPNIAVGTNSQYWNGSKLFVDFATSVRSAVLTGLNTATTTAIIATDSLLVAFGKLQGQMNGKAPTNHASITTTYGRSSRTDYGHSMSSSALPLMAGIPDAGLDNGKFANEGHIHKAQTTFLDTIIGFPLLNNIPLMQFVINTSTTDTYVATIPEMTAYIIGQPILLKATIANTTVTTLNINGLGAKEIRRNTNVALLTGDIVVNSIHLLIYDGTYFQLLSQGAKLTALQLATALTGFSATTTTPITADDTIITGLGKAQGQLNNKLSLDGGRLIGQLTTGGIQDVTIPQARNINAGTIDLVAGVSPLATGEIYLVYE